MERLRTRLGDGRFLGRRVTDFGLLACRIQLGLRKSFFRLCRRTPKTVMSKLGRNDPCPCGSGKKYKKCCLAQDEQRRREDARPDDLSTLFEDIPVREDVYDESDALEDFEEPSTAEIDQEPYVGKTISDDEPEISEAEQALVDAWWDDYKKLKDPDEILRHLNDFFDAHPDLVENLALHYEVLFELGAQLVEAGRSGEYIALLKQVRERFPDAYLKSYSYYDRDIIFYEVTERGCSAGIEDYLPWFEEYPVAGVDNLFEVIDFLMVTECDKAVMRLLEATYYPLCRSSEVFGGEQLLDPLILGYLAPSLDDGWTAADPRTLVERLQGIRIPLRAEWYDPSDLQAHHAGDHQRTGRGTLRRLRCREESRAVLRSGHAQLHGLAATGKGL